MYKDQKTLNCQTFDKNLDRTGIFFPKFRNVSQGDHAIVEPISVSSFMISGTVE
jgi:hypothetical protein